MHRLKSQQCLGSIREGTTQTKTAPRTGEKKGENRSTKLIITKLKDAQEVFNSRMDETEVEISKQGDKAIKSIQTK